jgi:aminoglycoside 6-adenylyltransferase
MDVSGDEIASGDSHANIMRKLLDWARIEDNIRALVQTGSSTRGGGQWDQFSDRDLELICVDPTLLSSDDSWIRGLAPIMVALYLDNASEDPETRLVFFEGMRKVDFTLAGRDRVQHMVRQRRLNDLYARGYTVLLDKDGLTTDLPPSSPKVPTRRLPQEREFTATVDEFWFEAAHMPTYLSRDDLWTVKLRDGTMKEMLLRMLEWQALLSHGVQHDVWHRGTKMKGWVEPDSWQELQACFGHFDAPDSTRALMATMSLFVRLTHEIADATGFGVPSSESHVHPYVMGLVS